MNIKKSLFKIYYKLFFHQYIRLKALDYDNYDQIHRKDIIQNTIFSKKYSSYLEVGCFRNEVFNYISCNTKIGVDPIQGGNVRLTSDNFFKNNLRKFDCIFIDGLHTYDQCKKDVSNSLKFLNENGIIFIHDCLPKSFLEQTKVRISGPLNWHGDVWKCIFELRTIDDIETYTINADHGIGVVLKKKNTNKLLIKKKINKLNFKDYYYNYKEYLRLISYDNFKKIF